MRRTKIRHRGNRPRGGTKRTRLGRRTRRIGGRKSRRFSKRLKGLGGVVHLHQL